MSTVEATYCSQGDMQFVLPSIDEYDTKRVLPTNWVESGTSNLYYLYNAGYVDQLYVDGGLCGNYPIEYNKTLKSKKFLGIHIKVKDKVEEVDYLSNRLQDREISNQIKDKIREKKIKYKILKFIQLKKTKILFNFKTPRAQFDLNPPKEFMNVLKMANDFVIDNNSNFYFVYLPRYERYITKDFSNQNYKEVKKIVENLNINFIDLKEEFDKLDIPLDMWPFRMWGHYNNNGYKKIAEIILRDIK